MCLVRWTPRNGSDGIWHRIDQRADQLTARGGQAQVGSAERHDPRVGVGARGDREAVGPCARAEHRVAGLGDAMRMRQAQRAPDRGNSFDAAGGRDGGACVEHVLRV